MSVDRILVASGAPGQRHQANIGEGDGVAVLIGADTGGVLNIAAGRLRRHWAKRAGIGSTNEPRQPACSRIRELF